MSLNLCRQQLTVTTATLISQVLEDSGGTYQLHIVDHFVFKTFERFNGIYVKGEGHSLQSLVLGTHADVCLHLNAPQTTFRISS